MEPQNVKPRSLFGVLLDSQTTYNLVIRSKEGGDKIFWSKQYLLGMISEINEVLDQLNWKLHRKDKRKIVEDNLGAEITDIFKYVLSLYELWGFSEDQILVMTSQKTAALAVQYNMENEESPVDQKILLSDLDGTIADWRKSFFAFCKLKGLTLLDDPLSSLSFDVDTSMLYPKYIELKEEFEEIGSYSTIVPFMDGVETVQHLQSQGVKIGIFTARPYTSIKRVWFDTWKWLQSNGINPTWMQIGAEKRIIKALEWSKSNRVVMFEDNPELAIRAASSGIKVFLRSAPYNTGVSHKNIVRVDKFDKSFDYFKED